MRKRTRECKINEILNKLKTLANSKAIEGMAKYGITPSKAYGVSIPNLRKIAKEIGIDHELAQQLWKLGIRETRILATLIDDPKKVTEEQMNEWANDFDYWEICDQCCMNLFVNTDFAYKKAIEWSSSEKEFVKRAGFALMASLAFKYRKTSDELFEKFFQLIKKEASDERLYVKKAVSWALRQIGKRNLVLNKRAIEVAKEIQKINAKSAKWIASDVLRELTSKKVQARLK
ncbi:MAG: DNA alkylation repair protein [Candidatus Asgardarchaeia archaeon]